MTIGERIKKFRKEAGFTQKQLATKCGVAEITIRQYESGKRQPRYEQLQIIAKALDMHLFDFLDDDLFDAATDPATEDNAMYEVELLTQKIKSIEENTELNPEEKNKLIQDFYIQTEIMADLHLSNAEAGNKFLINQLFEKLNFEGQTKALEQVEMLTKIPEYQKETK